MADNFVLTFDTNTSTGVTSEFVTSVREAVAADVRRRSVNVDVSAAHTIPETLDAPVGTPGDTVADVDWTAPDDDSMLLGYLVTLFDATPEVVETQFIAAGTETATFTSLVNDDDYTATVTALYGVTTTSDASEAITPTA